MITRDPSDRETVSLVTKFLEAVGEENVFIDSVLDEKVTEDRIPQPKLSSSGHDSLGMNKKLILLPFCSAILLISKYR